MEMRMGSSRKNEDRMTDDRERSRVASRYQCSDDYDIGGSFKQPSPWLSQQGIDADGKADKNFFSTKQKRERVTRASRLMVVREDAAASV